MTAGLPSPTAVVPARHVPERSCVACRQKRPQGEFLRLTKAEGVWAVQVGNRTGRGSYLCADTPACWAEKRLRRTFGAQASSISAELLARQAAQAGTFQSVPQSEQPSTSVPSSLPEATAQQITRQ